MELRKTQEEMKSGFRSSMEVLESAAMRFMLMRLRESNIIMYSNKKMFYLTLNLDCCNAMLYDKHTGNEIYSV